MYIYSTQLIHALALFLPLSLIRVAVRSLIRVHNTINCKAAKHTHIFSLQLALLIHAQHICLSAAFLNHTFARVAVDPLRCVVGTAKIRWQAN